MLQSAPPWSSVVRVAVSHARDAGAAVEELRAEIAPADLCFMLVFVPDRLAPGPLAAALDAAYAGVPVFGCTTAGQITPDGYETDALLAIAFPKAHFRCASLLIDPLNPLSIKDISNSSARLAGQFQRTAQWNRLGLLFADGLSKQEDVLVAALVAGLGEVPVFGGSAGDALQFRETLVLHGGSFRRNVAVLLLLETDLDFVGLGFDHFRPTDKQMVVTDAVPEERLVMEINGTPAAEEYARLVGCTVAELSPQVFAENPVLVRNSSLYHVRAIQGVHEGQGLSFLSAIDDGLLLTLGQGQAILDTLEEELGVADGQGRAPEFILGFDCFLRRLEIDLKQLTGKASEILCRSRVLGFNTYGEQHCGVHVNQTFVGVAFFAPQRRELH